MLTSLPFFITQAEEFVITWPTGIADYVMWILGAFGVLACIDKIIEVLTEKHPLGLAPKFDDAFNAFLPLCVAMLGILCLATIIADVLRPILAPVLAIIGADPGIIGGLITAIDMGGYPISKELATTPELGILGGIIVGSMLGVNWVFNIPVGLSIIKKEHYEPFMRGVLAGLVTVPIGVIVGGIVLGIEMGTLLVNTIPVIALAVVVAILLVVAPGFITKVFIWLGRIILAISVTGIAMGIWFWLTGWMIPRFVPITPENVMICGNICLVLTGAFTLVEILQRYLRGAFAALAKVFGTNAAGTIGFLATFANNIAMFNMFDQMDDRGRILNGAFQTGAAFSIADHLAFTMVFAPAAIPALLAAKVTAGVTSLPVAMFFMKLWKVGAASATSSG